MNIFSCWKIEAPDQQPERKHDETQRQDEAPAANQHSMMAV